MHATIPTAEVVVDTTITVMALVATATTTITTATTRQTKVATGTTIIVTTTTAEAVTVTIITTTDIVTKTEHPACVLNRHPYTVADVWSDDTDRMDRGLELITKRP